MKETIAILMASYNGERYIKDQIESIINQNFSDWHLFISDDGSIDNTLRLEKSYQEKFPQKITIVENKTNKHGSKYNFFNLLNIVLREKYNYFMFSDQDDVWKKNKVSDTFKLMKQAKNNTSVPILVHTDLEVVDENLKTLGNSFIKYRALDPKCKDINHLLIQNNVTGCTMMVNRPLLVKALQVENIDEIAMHDWWFALIASIYGKIYFLNESTIKYRQHSENVVGATNVNSLGFIIKRVVGKDHVKETINMSIRQAQKLLDDYTDIPQNMKKVIVGFSKINNLNKLNRQYYVIKNKILKQGTIQKIGEMIFI